ncbi:MAG: NVEALA domain-containing protein [Rikenellaceae bacterium]|nr:NVEALA domain-containing protein [Rikenellaceae bacterium]
MKRKLVVLCLAAVLAVSAFLFIQNRYDNQNDLLLANVEALAEDEASNTEYCPGGKELCASVVIKNETHNYYKK